MSPRQPGTPVEAFGAREFQTGSPAAAAPSVLPWPLIALGTCFGYYLGSVAGLHLRLPPGTPSVLWPPNAVLTSLLVLTSPRRWWLVLLGALPAHLYLELGTGWPLPLVLALFVTNCFEALLAAGSMSLLNDEPSRFDTLRRLTVFIASVLTAATLSSFADAAAVAWLHGESYWQVWQARLLSNALAALTVIPAVWGGLESLRWWSRRRLDWKAAEASILALSLCAIAWVDFSGSFQRIPAIRALSSQTPLAVQLPFLLWAAVRFGPAATGLTLLTTTLINAWAVVHGEGPFTAISATTTVTALSLSLIVVAVTVLCLATLIEERRMTQSELGRRLRFEGLLSRLSAALVEQPCNQMHRALDSWLGPIGAVLDIQALTLFVAGPGAHDLVPVYSWADPARLAAGELNVQNHHDSWARLSVLQDRPLIIAAGADPAAAGRVRSSALDHGEKRGAAIPLKDQEQVMGAMAFGPVGGQPAWQDLIANARLVAEVIATALGRKRSEEALRETELTNAAILQSLTSGVAVIDRSATLLQVNERWTLLTMDCEWMDVRIGDNLIGRCRTMGERGYHTSGMLADGVSAVLDGSRERFDVEYSIDRGAGHEWLSLSVVPLNRAGGGAVVICSDITELRRAELEAQRSRQDLAHVSRVSTVGEMTASLAHQLNQPLTAIMTNAQVAQRLLDSVPESQRKMRLRADNDGVRYRRLMRSLDFDELRAILGDIVADDRRATDIIVRLTKLLRKGELEMTCFDLSVAIQEIVELVSREAMTRDVAISIDSPRTPLIVLADRVQLQQVMLNLLQNAMEAMTEQRERPRTIVVSCHQLEDDDFRIRVTVCDSGPGVPAGMEETVFEPFYTTKAGGMGMGLSIVRSIVEAHGGSIRAVHGDSTGAHFEFFLPADPASTMMLATNC